MLKVSIHSGELRTRALNNQLAVLDIAYQRKGYVSDYLLALSARGRGEVAPDVLLSYPRWSASLWDLTARALTRILYRDDQAPPAGTPDRRCAYATRMCAAIELQTLDDRGLEIGTVQIAQDPKRRGLYEARFDEDILGPRKGSFEFGKKALDHAELLLRAICWTYYGRDTLGPAPALIVPPSMKVDGVDMFHLESLGEPAKTGFLRNIGKHLPGSKPAAMQRLEDYAVFLMQG